MRIAVLIGCPRIVARDDSAKNVLLDMPGKDDCSHTDASGRSTAKIIGVLLGEGEGVGPRIVVATKGILHDKSRT
ncbi:hypothetical protein DMENIID0001_053750 [Sergentomyia squamirostris]